MKKNRQRLGRPDAMKVLREARPGELDPSRLVDPARQRGDLARIVTEQADGHVTGLLAPRRRSGFRPLGAVALAAVAASVVVVGALDRQPADRPAVQPQASVAAVQPGGSEDVRVDGHLELLGAAEKAESSAAEGTYWQTTTRSENVDVAGEEGRLFAVRSTSTEEWSVGVRPGTGSLMVSGLDAVTEPRTAVDRARWRAAGSPGTVRVEAATGTGKNAIDYPMGTGRPTVMRTNIDDRIYAVGSHNISYQALRELPSTSDGLRRYLERLHAEDHGAGTGAAGRSAWMLRQAADLVTMPVKPGVRAAAYRMMADLPGVRVIGHVHDPLGREGVAVEFPLTYRTPLGTTQQQLVVDPSTGAMLSEQVVLVKASARAREAGLDAGMTVNYSATTLMSWGERQITVPENARG
ncbi:CU044_5270 family protein [Streptomyces sp. MS06]|uniref:CU044_5270 family protein n=1 Tax=Streptomyces sp. MS06 TaxID=3385974 RepID=UPI0039A13B73